LERVEGIEPSSSAWKAVALPLSYTRKTLISSLFL
jgi:hypothetical protein